MSAGVSKLMPKASAGNNVDTNHGTTSLSRSSTYLASHEASGDTPKQGQTKGIKHAGVSTSGNGFLSSSAIAAYVPEASKSVSSPNTAGGDFSIHAPTVLQRLVRMPNPRLNQALSRFQVEITVTGVLLTAE